MRLQLILSGLFCFFLLGGCAVKEQFQGQYYLNSGKTEEGVQTFRRVVAENPDDAKANYFLGRFLLAEEKPEEALPHLKKAASRDPENADYHFWHGFASEEAGQTELARAGYERALALEENHIQALTALGHNQLKNKEVESALTTYQKVLELWPSSPSALYNRALILKSLKRTPEEKLAWQWYLSYYPEGPLARRATTHLNSLGVFDYRLHILGLRKLVLGKIRFEAFSDRVDQNSVFWLDKVGNVLVNAPELKLYVLVYQKNNLELAKARAKNVRGILLERFPSLTGERIGISWFDVPERIEAGGRTFSENESVNLFAVSSKAAS